MDSGKLSVVAVIALLTACSATQPKFVVTAHPPLLDTDGGTALIVDVCVKEDVVGDDDYFVVTEAKGGAQALLDTANRYLGANGVQITTKLIPFVCGALHDVNNSPKKFAERLGGSVHNAQQPFAIADELKADAEYVQALGKMATQVFNHTLLPQGGSNAGSWSSNQSPPLVTSDDFKAATAVIATRTQRSSALYIGVTGNSESTGKAVGKEILQFAVGMATAAAIGPIPIGNNQVLGVAIMPSISSDQRQMVAGLVNLQSGEIVWSNVVHGGGDPIKPEVVADPLAVDLLLTTLIHKSSSAWSPPGVAQP